MNNYKESPIKTKPLVIDNSLSLKSRGLTSLLEISSWFSDNELAEIKELNLKGNNISDLEGIESYTSLEILDLSNNSFNKINQEDIDRINDINLDENKNGFSLKLYGNEISSNSWQSKIEVNDILDSYVGKVIIDNNLNHKFITDYDMVRLAILANNISIDEYHPKSRFHPKNEEAYENKEAIEKKLNSDRKLFWICIHLFFPLLFALIFYKFTNDFISGLIFGFFISVVFPFIAITSSTRKVKTGRSFEIENGLKLDEYKKETINGITLGKGHYTILFIHFVIAIIWFYVGNYV